VHIVLCIVLFSGFYRITLFNTVTDLHVHSSAADRQGSETTDCVGTSREQQTTFASRGVAGVELSITSQQ